MTLRWQIILPVLHVLFAAIWIIPENVQLWKILPRMQAAADYQQSHPESESDSGWQGLEDEFRPSAAARAIHFVDPIPGVSLVLNTPLDWRENRFWRRLAAPLMKHFSMLDRRAKRTLFAGLNATSAILITVFGAIAAFPFVHAMVSRMILEPESPAVAEILAIIGGLLALLTWLAWGLLSFGKFILTFLRASLRTEPHSFGS